MPPRRLHPRMAPAPWGARTLLRMGLLGVLLAMAMLCGGRTAAWAQAPKLPGIDRLASPINDAGMLDLTDPTWGFRFGIGAQYIRVALPSLHLTLPEGTPFSDGALIMLEAVLHDFRLAFGRRVYRSTLPANAALNGQPMTFFAFEADEFWAFYGVHPVPKLYLGYGVGWQERRYRFLGTAGSSAILKNESVLCNALLVDYAFALPMSIQLRGVAEETARVARVSGLTLGLSYHVPF